MRPLRLRLEEARERLGIPWDVLERDYLLSWVLAGIPPQTIDGNYPLKRPRTCSANMAVLARRFC